MYGGGWGRAQVCMCVVFFRVCHVWPRGGVHDVCMWLRIVRAPGMCMCVLRARRHHRGWARACSEWHGARAPAQIAAIRQLAPWPWVPPWLVVRVRVLSFMGFKICQTPKRNQWWFASLGYNCANL